MYIYLDVIVLLNAVVNGLILFLTGWVLGIERKAFGIAAAIFISVLYVLVCLIYRAPFLSHPAIKLMISALCVFLSFHFCTRRQFFLALGTFYLISFILGGAVLGYSFFMKYSDFMESGKSMAMRFNLSLLCKGLLTGSALIFFFVRPLLNRKAKLAYYYQVEIAYQDKQIRASGYLDSGNHLYTMSGDHPVILAETAYVKPLLSAEARRYLEEVDPADWIARLAECKDDAWLARVHLISYRGIGSADLLLGFRPDAIRIHDGGKAHAFSHVVGIYDAPFSSDGSYHVLLHAKIGQCLGERG